MLLFAIDYEGQQIVIEGDEVDEHSQESTMDEYVTTDEEGENYNDDLGSEMEQSSSEFADTKADNQAIEANSQRNGVQIHKAQTNDMLEVVRTLNGKSEVTCHELKELCVGVINHEAGSNTMVAQKRSSHMERKQSKQSSQVARKQKPTSMRKTGHIGSQQHGSGVIPKARIKTIKMTLVIVLAFILCWVPFCIINLCHVFGLLKNDTYVTTALMTLSQSLAHLNSAMNPIIFWLFSSRRNNQQNAHVTAASSEAPTTGRGSLVKGLVAIGGWARKAGNSAGLKQ